jgi:hypothetical protein
MTAPGFNAEAGMYAPATVYSAITSRPYDRRGAVAVEPQFRAAVRRQCGPCRDGKRWCVLWGYECSVIEGSPGSPELDIPPSPGHVRCEPDIFQEWEARC